MERSTELVTTEFVGSLNERLEAAELIRVALAIEPDPECGLLKFTLVDVDGKGVMKDTDGSTVLFVEPGQDRVFILELDPRWKWCFDREGAPSGEVMTFKARSAAAPYRVRMIDNTSIEITAKARSKGQPKTRDLFNLYVALDQGDGLPIKLRIDPGTNNPP